MKNKLIILSLMLCVVLCIFIIPQTADAATEGNYTYTVSNGEATITDFPEDVAGEITIPSTLGGFPVTSIGDYAFYNCYSLTSITIPDSVTSIGSYAFFYCQYLTSITIPEGVTSIGDNAFGLSRLKSIQLPSTLISIGSWAFEMCAFDNITIPKNLKHLDDTFMFCFIENFAVDADNEFFSSIDGSLYDKTQKTLIYYATAKQDTYFEIPTSVTSIGDYAFYHMGTWLTNITIPNSVTSIGNCAFSNCSFLESITIPDSVTSIGRDAFYFCQSLTRIIIPDSLSSVGDYAFGCCESLKDVYYRGTNKQWQSITIGSTNEYLTNANIITDCIYVNIFDEDGSELVNELTVAGYTFDYNSVPSKTGYTYKLYLNKEMTQEISKDTAFTEDTTAYGKYVINQYTYKFVDDNGKIIKSEIANHGTVIKLPDEYHIKENTKQYTYEFIGWDGYVENMILTSDITFSAKYNVTTNQYTYTFLDNDGNKILTDTVDYGTIIIKPDNIPIKPSTPQYSYDFYQWDGYTDGMTVTDDITFKPVFTSTVRKYTYEFLNYDGSIYYTKTVFYGDEISAPNVAPSKPKTTQYTYTFLSWDGYTDGMTITENISFEPIFIPTLNQYTYKFLDDSGNEIKSVTADYGTVIELPNENPEKENTKQYTYEFIGWDGYADNMTLTSDITFTPNFKSTVNQYTYTFLDDNGNKIFTDTVDYGTIITKPSTTPNKESTSQYYYTFSEWEGYSSGMTIADDITFKPIFTSTVRKYTYSFLDYDGSIFYEDTVDYGTTIETPTDVPEKSKTTQYTYTFSSWDGYTDGMTVAENISFEPIFISTVNQYTYKFIDDNGNEIKSVTADYGTVIELPESAPAKENPYVFDCWEGYSDGMTLSEDITFTPKFKFGMNRFEINGTDAMEVGSENINYNVRLATDKDAQYTTIYVKYPNELILTKDEKGDFASVSLESSESDGNYTTAEYLCIYSYDGLNIPKETVIDAFTLTFDVSKESVPKDIEIELTADSVLMGSQDYKFESADTLKITIEPKLAESIVINGDSTVFETAEYSATVLPDYTSDKSVTWSVSDNAIAEISEKGILTAKKNGTVIITATSNANPEVKATKTLTVSVNAKIDSLVTDGYMKKAFSPTTYDYIVYVDEDAEVINLSPVYTLGSVVANDKTILSGRTKEIELTGDETVITIERGNVTDLNNSTYTLTVIKDSSALITECEKASDGYDFKIHLNKNRIKDFENADILIALYNGEKLIKTEIVKITNEKNDLSIDIKTTQSASSYKIMLLEDTSNLKPLCIYTEKNIN